MILKSCEINIIILKAVERAVIIHGIMILKATVFNIKPADQFRKRSRYVVSYTTLHAPNQNDGYDMNDTSFRERSHRVTVAEKVDFPAPRG